MTVSLMRHGENGGAVNSVGVWQSDNVPNFLGPDAGFCLTTVAFYVNDTQKFTVFLD
jgi:hypothetical protein